MDTNYTLVPIDFYRILPAWQEHLWPNRSSDIESHSAMTYLTETYDVKNFDLPVWYLGIYTDDYSLVGVNSGHMCTDGSARSRGLWVDPQYRSQGLGTALLRETIARAVDHKAKFIWSYPRKTSMPTYAKVGFVQTSRWLASETSDANAYCYLRGSDS